MLKGASLKSAELICHITQLFFTGNKVLLFCKWPLTRVRTEKCEVTKMEFFGLQ